MDISSLQNHFSEPVQVWPFATQLPGIVIAHCAFNPIALARKTFESAHVPFRESLLKAVPKRQSEFLAGRLCALAALRALNRNDAAPGVGENREPLWDAEVVGSITHTHQSAFAAVALAVDYCGLGIDYEEMVAASTHENVATDILTETENEIYRKLGEENRRKFFTVVFSLKESLFKALYPSVKIFFNFLDARVSDIDHSTGTASITLLKTLSPHFQSGHIFSGHFCCTQHFVGSLIAVKRGSATR